MPIQQLYQEQAQAMSALEWLVNPTNRRVGKSLAMALAIIREACRHPGQWVHVIDHMPLNDMHERMMSVVDDFLFDDPMLAGHYRLTRRGIGGLVVDLPEPIMDWWPAGFMTKPHPDPSPLVSAKPKAKKAKKPASKWKNLGKI